MAKPWARYEIDYINGPKFLALTSNAHSLWWESKNYCDKHATDGFFPASTMRTFRFYSPKAVELLTRSCGPKTNGVPWAPLWETHDIGGVPYFKMHDYLDHNDCHDEVQERLSDAEQRTELKRLQAKKRKREERARRAEQIAALKAEPDASVTVTPSHAPVTQSSVTVTHQTQTETQTQTSPQPPKGLLVDEAVAEKAGEFLRRYPQIYRDARHGAHYQVKEARDFPTSCELVRTWPDLEYLSQMLELFLRKSDWKPKNEPGSPGQFRHMAPQCDALLRQHGATPAASRVYS